MTKRLMLGAFFALGLVLSAGVASAQAPAPSPAAITAAREIVQIKAGTMFDPVVIGVVESVKNSYLLNSPNLSKELGDVALQIRKELEPKKDELYLIVARNYAQRFTEQELKDMVTFYKSPLGKKMLTEEPSAFDTSMQQAQNFATDLSQQVLQKFRVEMKKKGFDL
jgi:hypothetical protein